MISLIDQIDSVSEFDTPRQNLQRERVKQRILAIEKDDVRFNLEEQFLLAMEFDKILDEEMSRAQEAYIRAETTGEAGLPEQEREKRAELLKCEFLKSEEGRNIHELQTDQKKDRWDLMAMIVDEVLGTQPEAEKQPQSFVEELEAEKSGGLLRKAKGQDLEIDR